MTFRVEHVIANHPETHIWMSADVSTVANTGCIILRNSLWSKSFLLDWLACKDKLGSLNEQLGLQCTIGLHVGVNPEQLSILDGATLNSLAPAMGKQLPHHQVHFVPLRLISSLSNAFTCFLPIKDFASGS